MKITQIKETCLYVNDLEKTKAFYHDLLGFPLLAYVPGKHVFFQAGISVLLCFNPEDSRLKTHLPPHDGSGHLHLAFEISKTDYDAQLTWLKAQRIPIEHEAIWQNGIRSCYFRDPDGHLLELVEPGLWDLS